MASNSSIPSPDFAQAQPVSSLPDSYPTEASIPRSDGPELNPEAAWFDLGGPMPYFNTHFYPPPYNGYYADFSDFNGFPQNPPPPPPPMPPVVSQEVSATTMDDLKLMIHGIYSRLDAVDRLEKNLSELLNRPNAEVAINGLKNSMKSFSEALVGHMLGDDVELAAEYSDSIVSTPVKLEE